MGKTFDSIRIKWEAWKRERRYRKVLRQVARQHISLIKREGVECWIWFSDLDQSAETQAALRTAEARGWIEQQGTRRTSFYDFTDGDTLGILEEHVKERVLGREPRKVVEEINWRPTGSGWAVLNRDHEWKLVAVFLGVLGVIVTFI